MPSLIRFVVTLAVLGALGYGGLLALVTFFEPQQHEITVTIPANKLNK